MKKQCNFFSESSVNDLWKRAFIEEVHTVLAIQKEGKNGRKFHDAMVETFLSEYENTQKLKIPKIFLQI